MIPNSKKENLTIDIIKKDIKLLCKNNIIYDLFFLSLVAILLLPILFINKIEYVTPVFFIVFLFSVLYFGYDIFIHLKIFINMKKGNYTIETDKLVQKKQNGAEYYRPFKPSLNLFFDTPNIFYFYKYKKYRISPGHSYSFSKKYCMNSNGIYRLSNIGDEFYLLVCNRKVVQIYNTNLFELEL